MELTGSIEWMQSLLFIGIGILTGLYAALKVVDRIWRFFTERRLRHFERAISYFKKDEKSSDFEFPLYEEGLRQELFMLAFGMRKARRFREELLTLSEGGEVNLAEITELGGDVLKLDNGRLVAKPNRWLLIFGWLLVVIVTPLAVLPIFTTNTDGHPLGALLMIISGAVSGFGLGLMMRLTIRPYYLAKKFQDMLNQHYESSNREKNSSEATAIFSTVVNQS